MRTLIPLSLCLVLGAAAQSQPLKPLALPAEFAAVRDLIAPKPDEELWKTIPWKTSLLEARQAATQQGKPLFVWSMHGHP